MNLLASIIFILGYIGIALEHKLKISKSALALITGAILWLIVALQGGEYFRQHIFHSGAEIFEIIVFLLAAMSLVEILVHYKFFDLIRGKLFALGLDNKKQFLIISVMAFFLSAIIDNLTCTIVMVQIARRFFKEENLLLAVAGIIIAANAGGAFSPIGDVTTIMLWLGDKFGTLEIVAKGFLPALTLYLVAILLIWKKITNAGMDDETKEIVTKLGRSEKTIIGLVFASFALPILMNLLFNLPPYLGLLIGLGGVWIAVDILKQIRPKPTHLTASIEKLIKQTDIPSLKFFIGILLAVGALHSLGILEQVSQQLYGHNPGIERFIIGNISIGMISAILDNVPLAAISMQILHTDITSLWILLALTLGTGGSLLVIGSAAGVIAMGMIKELNFIKYLQIAFVPALLGFIAGIGVWLIQYFVFGF